MVTPHSDLNRATPVAVPLLRRIDKALRCTVMLMSAWFCLPAWAADADVSIELTAWAVGRGDDGKERLSAADRVKPGELLQYRAVYTNHGRQQVRNLVASLPIPVGTELIEAPGLLPATTASIDGKVFAATPLMRKVRAADGRMVDEPVPLAEYRVLRWPQHDLASNTTFSVGARVRVVAATATAPSRNP
jgi:hypothetical protein